MDGASNAREREMYVRKDEKVPYIKNVLVDGLLLFFSLFPLFPARRGAPAKSRDSTNCALAGSP